MLMPIHIAAGELAIVLGAVALIVKKGGNLHRRSGLLFICAMLVMGITGSIAGLLKNGRTDGNWIGGLITAYFVGTALTTVRPATPWTRRINVAALAVALGVAFVNIVGGVMAFNSPRHGLNGVPFVMYFVIAAVMIFAATGDVRFMRPGVPGGGARLTRHLWRMCFSLFMAAVSFFGSPARVAKILPRPFTTGPMRALPFVLLFGAMFYWMWRVRARRTLAVIVPHDAMSLATRAE